MEPLSTFLSSLLGKVVAGSAVAAASVAGMNAADVVELPLPDLSDKPAEVDTDATPVEPVTPAEDKAKAGERKDEGDDAELAEEELEVDAEETDVDADAADPEANDFGQTVAGMAQGGTTGQELAEYARENNPGAAQREDAGAPEATGERQDTDVRQDDGAGQDDEVPPGAEVAEERTPEEPGSQGDANRGGTAAGDARP